MREILSEQFDFRYDFHRNYQANFLEKKRFKIKVNSVNLMNHCSDNC